MDGSSIERVARVSGQSWRTFREEEEKSTETGLECTLSLEGPTGRKRNFTALDAFRRFPQDFCLGVIGSSTFSAPSIGRQFDVTPRHHRLRPFPSSVSLARPLFMRSLPTSPKRTPSHGQNDSETSSHGPRLLIQSSFACIKCPASSSSLRSCRS